MGFGYIDSAEVDFIVNGRAQGPIAEGFAQVGYDAGLLRPMIMDDGKKYCYVATGGMVTNKQGKQVPERKHIPLNRLVANGMVPPTYNVSALSFEAWRKIDTAVLKASRDRLSAWNDMVAASHFTGFNGMSMTGLARDTVTDTGDAKVDMDTMSNDVNDAPLFVPDILPLPIIHAGFELSERRLATSRNAGMPLDTLQAENAGERCAETLEKMVIGVDDYSSLVFDDSTLFTKSTLFGYRTHDYRITKTDITAPADPFVTSTFVTEVLEMIEDARAQKFFGPFVLYYSTSWDKHLDKDYVVGTFAQGYTTVDKTVRQRVEMISKIQRVAMLDFFTNTDELLLVQMSSKTVRAVTGMEWTTVQWVEQGGAKIVFRVMGIKVPDIRGQFIGTSITAANRKCGVVHGTTS